MEKMLVAKLPEKEAQRLLKAFAVLVRNTTWKCGRVERHVVTHLRTHFTRFGNVKIPIKEMTLNFKLSGKKKSEFLEALKRLEKRHIIEIEAL